MGHPDLPHLPPSSPPRPFLLLQLRKNKSPSQLRCQKRRQQEAWTKADQADQKTHNNDGNKKNLHDGITNDKLAEVIVEAEAEINFEPPCLFIQL